MRFERILISVLALATVAKPAWATSTTIYCTASCGANDQTAFNNATSSVFFQGITFTGANLTASTTYSDPSGVTITDYVSNNTLSVSAGNLVDTNSWGFAASLPNVVYDFWFTVTGLTANLNIAFTTPDGFHSYSLGPSGGALFFGVTSSAPITGLIFQQGSSNHTTTLTAFDINGSAAATPEATTLLLIGTGLILMRFFKKRDKARARLQPQSPETQPARFVSPQIVAS